MSVSIIRVWRTETNPFSRENWKDGPREESWEGGWMFPLFTEF